MTNLAFIDCETTGLDPRVHTAWEVAAILREPGMPDIEHVWQFRPVLTAADPVALKVGRFEERFALVDNGWDAGRIDEHGHPWGMSYFEALIEVQAVLKDARLVAANTGFDDANLKALFHAHDLRVSWHYRLMCVENLVAGALRLPETLGLRESAEAMGVKVDPAEAHTAIGDARVVRDTYDVVMT